MKSKAPLILMEQMAMLLVFALAAALCLQAFVKSDSISRRSEDRDRAAALVQTVAETVRSSGDAPDQAIAATAEKLGYHCEQATLWQDFDKDWAPVEQEAGVYRLDVQSVPTEVDGLNVALVAVVAEEESDVLFSVEVAWQGGLEHNG